MADKNWGIKIFCECGTKYYPMNKTGKILCPVCSAEYIEEDLNLRQAATIITKSEPKKLRQGNPQVNKATLAKAEKLGITPEKLGKEEYQKKMAQAAIEALTDSNYHTEARELVAKFYSLIGASEQNDLTKDWLSTGIGLVNYPHAKQLLLELGYTQSEVESMPVLEALIRQAWDLITHTRDERMKWYGLPYWQNYKALGELDEGLNFLNKSDLFSIMNRMLIPALSKAQIKFVTLDQKFTMLRAIEACRMQLALNPEQPLTEWPDVAVHFAAPIDPGTGSPILIRSFEGFTELQTYAPTFNKEPKVRRIRLNIQSEDN